MKMPEQAVTINRPSWDMTLLRFATPRILAQMTLLIPIGEIHMIPLTIFIITSSITLKKVMTDSALRPMDPRTVPKVRQKKMMPSVLVPPLYARTFLYSVVLVAAFSSSSYFVPAVWKVAWKRLSGTMLLPRSRKLSMISIFRSAWLPDPTTALISGLPGWMMMTRMSPMVAASKEVTVKKTIVLIAIIPFIFAFRLAAPVIKLAMMRGRIMSLRSRMKSSPG